MWCNEKAVKAERDEHLKDIVPAEAPQSTASRPRGGDRGACALMSLRLHHVKGS